MNLDQVNASNEPYGNCVFDFIDAKPGFGAAPPIQSATSTGSGLGTGAGMQTQQGTQGNISNNALRFGTINTRTGKVYFPVLQPFGDNLQKKFDDESVNPEIAKRYVYNYLYDSTRVIASMFPEWNRYFIKGTYKSSVTSEIALGAFNIPKGSVRVTAGGMILTEGVDYEVNYNLGRLISVNDAIVNSGVPVNVSFEDNGTFGLQQRTFIGTRSGQGIALIAKHDSKKHMDLTWQDVEISGIFKNIDLKRDDFSDQMVLRASSVNVPILFGCFVVATILAFAVKTFFVPAKIDIPFVYLFGGGLLLSFLFVPDYFLSRVGNTRYKKFWKILKSSRSGTT